MEITTMNSYKMTAAITILLLSPAIAICSDNPTNAINKVLNAFHKAASDSDYPAYFDKFAQNAFFLGTDASERWSLEEFKRYAKPAFEAGRGWHYDVVARNVEIKGDVAWFDEQLNNSHLGRCRGTGVLIQTDNGWKVAHYSLTLLVPNKIADKVGAESMAIMGMQGQAR
jgi:ketosteroid isomerase-like protein